MVLKTMPFARPYSFVNRLEKDPTAATDELWFIFNRSQLLVHADSMRPFHAKELLLECTLYMGTFRNCHLHIGEMASSAELPRGAIWADLRALHGVVDDELYALAGRAVQLISWERTHKFCGQCGSRTEDKPNERAKECKACGHISFPKISPAIMALVQRDDEVLLARGTNFPKPFYSALAGFVEPGETLEQCVEREVFEEVGLHVDNITYFASQSWPFPNSLMIAFTCSWKSGEITLDPTEIADAQWFKKESLPMLPSEISISRILIDAVLFGK